MQNINYIGILNYLYCNREIPFTNPERTDISEEEKNKYLLMQQHGQEAVAELSKIADRCKLLFGLKHISAESWLDSSGTKTRKSLCVNMKYGDYADNPISVSIVVEKNGSLSRYKVCLEIKNDGVEKTILEKFHTHLDLPIDNGMCYVGPVNEWGNPDSISKSVEVIKDMVAHKELRKVQPCVYIETSSKKTNDEYDAEILEGVKKLFHFTNMLLAKKAVIL